MKETTSGKFYWLKLKDDIFDSKRISIMRSKKGGDTMLVIYLRLQLDAIKNNGVIRFCHLEETFEKEQAVGLGEKTETVKRTMEFLLSSGLCEKKSEDEYFFPFAVENTGSETKSSIRSKTYRERKKNAEERWEEEENNPVTLPSRPRHAADTETSENRHRDIEIEKEIESELESEKEKDKDKVSVTVSEETVCRAKDARRVMEAWNQLGLPPVKTVSPETNRGKLLRARIRKHGVEEVLSAVEKAGESAFLRGQNTNGWTITFDWFLKPNNFIKVLEGNYGDRCAASPSGGGTPFLEMIEEGYFHD